MTASVGGEHGPARVGVIGCGNISGIYFENGRRFAGYEVISAADLDHSRAVAPADEVRVRKSLLGGRPAGRSGDRYRPQPDHPRRPRRCRPAGDRGRQARLRRETAGDRPRRGPQLLDAAAERGVRVGCAPDTFLGGGLQTCRKLIDDGAIGKPVAATAFMLGRGPESWHPNPEFYYSLGGGPDVRHGAVLPDRAGLAARPDPARHRLGARSLPEQRRSAASRSTGETIDGRGRRPTSPAVLDFAAGPVGTLVTSFDVWAHETPRIEIYGTRGHAQRARPEHLRRPGAAAQGRRASPGARCR